MSTLALTLLDFQAALPFSNKIEDRQVQPFVALTLELDLVPLLGHAVLDEVAGLAMPEMIGYVPAVASTAGTYYLYQGRVYLATTDELLTRPGTADAWVYQPLLTLWTQYLKPYWLHRAYARFLPQHGVDVTKAGMTQPNDPAATYVRAASADRAVLIASAESTAEALRSRLTAFLSSEAQAFAKDNATGYAYPVPNCQRSHSPRAGGLRGINRRTPYLPGTGYRGRYFLD